MNQPALHSLPRPARIFFLLFLLLALAFFAMRGPWRGISDGRDFAIIYLASKAWVLGLNPYDEAALSLVSSFKTGDLVPGWSIAGFPSLYPLCTYALMSPLALLPWPQARLVWLIVNSLAFLASLFILLRLMAWKPSQLNAILFLVVSLTLFPVHVAIFLGQPTIPTILFGLLSVLALSAGLSIWSGIFLALSLGLKSQIGITFLAYTVLRRGWRALIVALGIVSAVTFLALERLGWGNWEWLSSWAGNLREVTTGGLCDPSLLNPIRYHLLNLQFPLSMIFHDINLANFFTLTIVGFLILLLLKHLNFMDNLHNLLSLNTILIISLFPTYHRFYDAAVIVAPLLATVHFLSSPYKISCRIALIAFLPFIVFWQDLINYVLKFNYINPQQALSWWWNIVVLPLQVYCLLLISFIQTLLAKSKSQLVVN